MNSVGPYRITREADRGRFDYMYGIHVVAATRDDKTEFWASAAATPTKALAEVLLHLPSGWIATLTGESLTLGEATELDFRPNEARRLVPTTKRLQPPGIIGDRGVAALFRESAL
jgi:hypothetical protein